MNVPFDNVLIPQFSAYVRIFAGSMSLANMHFHRLPSPALTIPPPAKNS